MLSQLSVLGMVALARVGSPGDLLRLALLVDTTSQHAHHDLFALSLATS
jgi:hypothetical protein